MVRGYPPALLHFRAAGGLACLVALLREQAAAPRLQRKCLQVLQYLLRVVPLDRGAACVDAPLLQALRWVGTLGGRVGRRAARRWENVGGCKCGANAQTEGAANC